MEQLSIVCGLLTYDPNIQREDCTAEDVRGTFVQIGDINISYDKQKILEEPELYIPGLLIAHTEHLSAARNLLGEERMGLENTLTQESALSSYAYLFPKRFYQRVLSCARAIVNISFLFRGSSIKKEVTMQGAEHGIMRAYSAEHMAPTLEASISWMEQETGHFEGELQDTLQDCIELARDILDVYRNISYIAGNQVSAFERLQNDLLE